jgi:hypothetical protein
VDDVVPIRNGIVNGADACLNPCASERTCRLDLLRHVTADELERRIDERTRILDDRDTRLEAAERDLRERLRRVQIAEIRIEGAEDPAA